MKKKKLKGLWIFVLAAIICATLLNRSSNDIYSTNRDSTYFHKRYLADYTGQDTNPQVYVSESNAGIAVYTLRDGAISLRAGTYDVGFLYYEADENTVFKIFSSDYISADNSGGKILVQQNLLPQENYLKTSFTLDQDVNSVYIYIETNAPDFTVGYLLLESWSSVCTDTTFYCVLTLLCAVLIFWVYNASFSHITPAVQLGREISSRRVVWTFVFVATIAVFIASLPLLQTGLISGHDLPFQMARIEGIASGLMSGQFPVRVHGETLNGFGYPNSYFYPELLMYLPALLRLLGVNTVTCYKFYLIFIHALTLIAAYFPFKKLFHSRVVGLTLAVIYVLNPYRLICAYYRAAVGELTAITFLPLVVYGMYAVLVGMQTDWPYLVIGATGLLQSHILSTELTVFFCAALALVFIRQLFTKGKRLYTLIIAAVYTVLLNTWFLCPMLIISISIRPAVFTRVQSPFGFTKYDISHLFTTGSLTDIGPHPIGWLSLFALGLYLIYRIAFVQDQKTSHFSDVLAITTAGCSLATTAWFPWDLIAKIPLLGGLLDAIQFPYRLMSLVGVCSTALVGYTLLLWTKKNSHRLVACLSAVCIALFTAGLLFEGAFLDASRCETKHYYISHLNNSLSVGQYEYLASGAEIGDIVDTSPVITSSNNSLQISNMEHIGTTLEFCYELNYTGEDQIILPLTYIPKYQVLVDDVPVEISKTENCRVAFTAPSASGTVSVRYSEPFLFRIFELISLVTLLVFLLRKPIWKLISSRFCKQKNTGSLKRSK